MPALRGIDLLLIGYQLQVIFLFDIIIIVFLWIILERLHGFLKFLSEIAKFKDL